jgi:O-antigen/teichoic acid export membrane protein
MPLLIAKRTGRLFGINFLAALFNVSSNALLIPRLGFVGAGITFLATFALLALGGMLASRSEAHVPFELSRLAGIVSCVLAGGACALWIDTLDATSELSVPLSLAAKLLALVVSLGLLWKGVLHDEERVRFRGWLAARRRAE